MADFEQQEERLRQPPHSQDAEQAVLAGVLLDANMWDKVTGRVSAPDFYNRAHQLIYKAIETVATRNQEALDVVTVADALREAGELDNCGGTAYLASLADAYGSAQNVAAYADIVREASILRALLKSSGEIAQSVYQPEGRSAAQLLDSAEQRVFDIKNQYQQHEEGKDGLHPIKNVLTDTIEYLQEVNQRGSDVIGIPTGFKDLDKMTAGMQAGDLIIIAGRPSMGKTTFAMNIAEAVAIGAKQPVAVFSLEMPARALVLRMMSSLGNIDQSQLRKGDIKGNDTRGKLALAVSQLQNAPLYIDDGSNLTITELRARVRRLKSEVGALGLVLVDYLQLMQLPDSRDDNRASLIGEISRGLKLLAKEMDVPVIALSQLSRQVEHRPNKRPIMSDIRESGAIEQDADVIMFVYRDEVYNPDSPEKGIAEIVIGKQRNGPIGTVKLSFLGQYLKFGDLAQGYSEGFDE
ncbi:replicative DNA helicase [Cardiobacterium valvarum]|uniref:Replicative DNA helicase n=1 Tax=Cardiobacterium valvarum F0432 TaxID=797473 RepID=G9ZD36_9GAMM|nr:replicative DNA helicase [Cardiobacterium valvarum]EHM55501.1 replicative DNA helicase [Cardiobacterium valvarum F0432]